MSAFKSRLKGTVGEEADDDEDGSRMRVDDDETEGRKEDGDGMEVDDDRGFLGHVLNFPKGNEEEMQKAEREYEVIDPRQRGARAKEEERDRKRKMRPKDGGRGSRR